MFPRLLPGLVLLLAAVHASADTFVVTNTNDAGAGSLRQAITNANAHANSGAIDNINFNIPGSGVRTIIVASALPEITDPVIIDGWTQPGWNGAPRIQLTGATADLVDGLTIAAGGTTIRGLVMNGFKAAIFIQQNGNNSVQGCYLGTDSTGQQAAPNDTGISGLVVSNTVIGGLNATERNIISGNRYNGIYFTEFDSRNIQGSGNVIQGNYVGTDVTGTIAVPNCTASGSGSAATRGMTIISNGTKIGGPEPGAGNLVSGNAGGGIYQYGFSAVIAGNLVGTDVSGSVALPNKGTGIFMASLGGTLGGTTAEVRNVVANNTGTGIVVESSDGRVQGNFVGTDVTGKVAMPNGGGMAVSGFRNLIGGDTPGAGNLISGNSGSGVVLYTSFSTIGFGYNPIPPIDNLIQGNLIGTDVTGTVALPNSGDGILFPGYRNRIGGHTPGTRNLISGNAGNGIRVTSAGDEVRIQGNFIGTQADGIKPLGNGGHGIALEDARRCIIGSASGADIDAANTIAFNLGNGIDSTPTSSNTFQRISANSIHDNGMLGIHVDTAQPYPVLSDAFAFEGKLTVYGNLATVPPVASAEFIVEFFANAAADPSGFGEGQMFLGEARVTTDGSGNAKFNVTFTLPPSVTTVTATAIKPNATTSQFSADATIVTAMPGPAPTPPTVVYPASHSLHLLNIATRLRVETGDHALIAGFIVAGSESKKVIVRGIGPSLSNSGVPGVLANPVLELHDASGNLLGSNDDWRTTQESAIQMSGVAPTNDSESAIVATLPPGNYTAVLRGKDDGTGVGLVDIYDLAQSTVSHLGNVSTRGFVGTGDNVMIGGFIVGDNGGGTNVVIRALGPSLSAAGISDALLDPYLELRNSSGSVVDFNDNWHSAFGADQISAAHLAPTDDRESALYRNLAPGNYTAIVRGKNNAVGVATVELYDLGPQ